MTRDATETTGLPDSALPASEARPSDEMLPFLNNFHDIFTTIGVLILFGGLLTAAIEIYGRIADSGADLAAAFAPIGLSAVIGVIAWLLSALLVGRQRRILPGVALSVAATLGFGAALFWMYLMAAGGMHPGNALDDAFSGFGALLFPESPGPDAVLSGGSVTDLPLALRALPIAAALCVLAPTLIYYLTFRLPFAGGVSGVAAAWTAVAVALAAAPTLVTTYWPLASLSTGLALFVAGIWFDARDPSRVTRLSGTGFWLHFFAAPTLLGAALTIATTGVTLGTDPESQAAGSAIGRLALAGDEGELARWAAVTLGVIAAFALVSLLINRRALIVSGLVSAGIAVGVLANQAGLGGSAVVAASLLLVGAVVVVLGAAWRPVRRVLVAPFPKTGALKRIIPPADMPE